MEKDWLTSWSIEPLTKKFRLSATTCPSLATKYATILELGAICLDKATEKSLLLEYINKVSLTNISPADTIYNKSIRR